MAKGSNGGSKSSAKTPGPGSPNFPGWPTKNGTPNPSGDGKYSAPPKAKEN